MADARTGPAPVAVLASRLRPEEEAILAALERRGIVVEYVDSRSFWLSLARRPPGYRAVLNREIAHSRALHAALALEASGAPVLNSAAAIETCGDKWRTAVALRAAGLPIPRTALALSAEAALAACAELGYPVVFKPLTSSWGRRVTLIEGPAMAEAVLEYCAALPAPQARFMCVQEPIAKPDRDIRVVVVGGQAVGAMYRQSAQWRTNLAAGATARPCALTPGLADLAARAAAATGAQVAGVDLVEGRSGQLYLLEVNGRPEFAGLAGCTGIDVAGIIVEHLLAQPADQVTVSSGSRP